MLCLPDEADDGLCQTGGEINKVNKSAMWKLLSINTVHSVEWEEIACNITANE